MGRKYIRTTLGTFIEEDSSGGTRPGRCQHCGRKQERQPTSCQNTSELVEMAGVVAEERTGRDDPDPMTIDFLVACGLLRRGYRRERR